ncbi:MAG: hypothetical protein GY797_02810 [Deltaproteobacteria bacterium]|nr:hypothetical protein [Deltaproteobacteria bacterium]
MNAVDLNPWLAIVGQIQYKSDGTPDASINSIEVMILIHLLYFAITSHGQRQVQLILADIQ